MGRERDSRKNLEVRTFGACDWALGSGVSGLLGSATRKSASKESKSCRSGSGSGSGNGNGNGSGICYHRHEVSVLLSRSE